LNLSQFIARRIAFNQEKTFSRFIIRLSIIATVISVAAMIITLSFVNGFQETVSNKVFSFLGHIRIQYRQPMRTSIAEEIPIEKNDKLFQTVRRMPDVSSVHSFGTKSMFIKAGEEIDGLLLKGFEDSLAFIHLNGFLQKGGRWVNFNDSSYARELVLSQHTANVLQLKVNDRPFIYFLRPDGSLRPDRVTIVGIYKTGIGEYDKAFALGDIKLIRQLNGWSEKEIGGYEIFLKDYRQMGNTSAAIYDGENFPSLWETKTATEINPSIFDWLKIVNYNSIILIVIVTVIVVINFITCLIILVLERVRMIGILKAIGTSDWSIQKIFLYHSALITLTGILLGTIISVLFLWVQMKTGFVKLKEAEYYMDTAAVRIDPLQVLSVIAGTLLISIIVLIIPSLLVRKIQPIKAIRFH
jgi:lipoprotein-releasing system permease protein